MLCCGRMGVCSLQIWNWSLLRITGDGSKQDHKRLFVGEMTAGMKGSRRGVQELRRTKFPVCRRKSRERKTRQKKRQKQSWSAISYEKTCEKRKGKHRERAGVFGAAHP